MADVCLQLTSRHPQTILAYGLNGQTLPVANGAPIRVRIERALGYEQPKYVHSISCGHGEIALASSSHTRELGFAGIVLPGFGARGGRDGIRRQPEARPS